MKRARCCKVRWNEELACGLAAGHTQPHKGADPAGNRWIWNDDSTRTYLDFGQALDAFTKSGPRVVR